MRLSLLFSLVALVAGCGPTTTTPDLAVIPVGCRAPGLCFDAVCGCRRSDLTTPPDGGCLICDPTQTDVSQQTCTCTSVVDSDLGTLSGQVCIEPLQLCVGRGVVCPGVGARCFPAGFTGCATATGGDTPALVAAPPSDAGVPASEQRCNFADDVCCPGVVDMAVPDLGGPEDLAGGDAITD